MSKLCFGCMQQKENSPVCELCGFDEQTENQPHQLPIGTLLQNQYLVGKVLGQGGFGITYMGWDQHLSIPVAIKEYFPNGVVQRHTVLSTKVSCTNGKAPEVFAKHKERFLKEARTLAQLSEIPEIVQIKSFFSGNDTAYIVMEYVQGITLKDQIKKLGRPMTEAEALAIMEPVLKALQKVHDHGLIHRDISPDNIMLPQNGGVKLIDFGTVRYMDDSGQSKSTEAVLKAGFSPMEQYNTHGNLGTWTDVYAVCATFHYLLTGKVPADVHARLDQGESLTLLRNQDGTSQKMISALEKGMKIRYQERVQTIGELCRLLYEETDVTPVMLQRKEKKKRKSGILAACILGAAAVGAAAMLLIPKKEASGVHMPAPEVTAPTTQNDSTGEPSEPLSPRDRAYAEAERLLAQGDTAGAALIFANVEEYDRAELLIADGEIAQAALVFGKLGDFADAHDRSTALWDQFARRDSLCAGGLHTVGLRTDGTVLAKGANYCNQCEVGSWSNITAISAGETHTVGLKADGSVIAAGDNLRGQCNVDTWTDIVAISAGYWHTAGLHTDGTVITTHNGELGWTDIVDICCYADTSVIGLKADGTVVTNGDVNLSGWKDITAIAAGKGHVVGLKKDGTVIAAGSNLSGQCDVEDWHSIVALSASGGGDGSITGRTIGLQADGIIIATGSAWYNTSYWVDIVKISSGTEHFVALRSDGTVYSAGNTQYGKCDLEDWTDIKVPAANDPENQGQEPLPEAAPSEQQSQYAAAEQLLAEGETAKAAIAFGKLGNYSDARERSLKLWREVAPTQIISASNISTAAVRNDGTVVLAGNADTRQGQCMEWKDIIAVSTCSGHIAGIKKDGTVVAAGATQWGQCDVSSWTDIVAVETYQHHYTVGLKADGTVVYTGSRGTFEDGHTQIDEVSSWTDIAVIRILGDSIFGLKTDGTVVVANITDKVQSDGFRCGVDQALFNHWSDIIAISRVGRDYYLGLRADGTVVEAQTSNDIRTDVSHWSDIIAIASGTNHNIPFIFGLRSDGTVLSARLSTGVPFDISDWSDIVAIAAGSQYVIGVRNDGSVVFTGKPDDVAKLMNWVGLVQSWRDIKLP